MIWPLYATIIGGSILIWMFVFFSYWRGYRYATILFDLLPVYPILALIGFGGVLTGSILWLGFPYWIPFLIIGLIITPLLIFVNIRWLLGYRMKKYEELLAELSQDKYDIRPFKDYFSGKKNDPNKITVYIRHDVDISLQRQHKMAELEKKYGIQSTYLFRLHAERYEFEQAKPIIQDLVKDGFEIGFHYESLSQTKGDSESAIKLFAEELKQIREITPIHIVAAHGDKYKNRTIWPSIPKEKLKVWSCYDLKRDHYISDAGGYDMFKRFGHHLFQKLTKTAKGEIVQILIHPDWWF